MRPIRGHRSRGVVHDPWGGNERQIEQTDVAHILSDTGAIESHQTERRTACGCGCLNAPGGFCTDCKAEQKDATVCVSCFGHCEQGGCGKPTCRRHSAYAVLPSGEHVRLCLPCHEAFKRRRLLRLTVRLLLPFSRADREDE